MVGCVVNESGGGGGGGQEEDRLERSPGSRRV